VEIVIRLKESENVNQATIRKLRYQLLLAEGFMSTRSKVLLCRHLAQDVTDSRASWKFWDDLTPIKAEQRAYAICCVPMSLGNPTLSGSAQRLG
jgi:hypothetical protein